MNASAHDVGVRPYLITGGRTPSGHRIDVETLIETSLCGRDGIDQLRFEERAIAVGCFEATSLAEIAARVRVPLGVARVLVADLAERGLVCVHEAPTQVHNDISLIQRLIHGVREL
jgi:Protein of unknown function (DUF742)